MGGKKQDTLEIRIEKLKAENHSLKKGIVCLKKDKDSLNRSLREKGILLNSLPAGIILIRDENILEINNTILEQLGYEAEEVIGHNYFDFILSDEEEEVRKLHDIWNSGKKVPEQYDVHMVTRDGETVYYNVNVNRIIFRSRKSFLLNLTQLEKIKEIERVNILSNKREALNTMASGVKHKVTRCHGLVQEITKKYSKLGSSGNRDLEKFVLDIKDALNESLDFIQKLDVITGAEDYQSEMKPIDLNETVNKAVSAYMEDLEVFPDSKGCKFDLKTYLRSSAFIEGDPGEITDVILFIISNAVEAMPDGGEILITTEDNAGYAHIFIQDSGPGIPDKIRDNVFDPFFSTKGDNSRGLGLTVAQAIVRRHMGDIEITSQEDQGTMFHVSLPLSRQKRKQRSKVNLKSLHDARILIIQNEDVARELLFHLFMSKGCRVDTANNGLEGLGKLKRKKFDLVISDADALPSGGNTLVDKFGKTNPKMAVALIKGPETVNSGDYGSQVDLIINKPLDVNNTLKKVSEILTRGRIH